MDDYIMYDYANILSTHAQYEGEKKGGRTDTELSDYYN